jgi:hypothetical protein
VATCEAANKHATVRRLTAAAAGSCCIIIVCCAGCCCACCALACCDVRHLSLHISILQHTTVGMHDTGFNCSGELKGIWKSRPTMVQPAAPLTFQRPSQVSRAPSPDFVRMLKGEGVLLGWACTRCMQPVPPAATHPVSQRLIRLAFTPPDVRGVMGKAKACLSPSQGPRRSAVPPALTWHCWVRLLLCWACHHHACPADETSHGPTRRQHQDSTRQVQDTGHIPVAAVSFKPLKYLLCLFICGCRKHT